MGFPSKLPAVAMNYDWYNFLMRAATELYQYLAHDEVFFLYADCLHYEEHRLVMYDKDSIAFLVCHAVTSALNMEPVYLTAGSEN